MLGVEGKATPEDTELNERLNAWAADAGALSAAIAAGDCWILAVAGASSSICSACVSGAHGRNLGTTPDGSLYMHTNKKAWEVWRLPWVSNAAFVLGWFVSQDRMERTVSPRGAAV